MKINKRRLKKIVNTLQMCVAIRDETPNDKVKEGIKKMIEKVMADLGAKKIK